MTACESLLIQHENPWPAELIRRAQQGCAIALGELDRWLRPFLDSFLSRHAKPDMQSDCDINELLQATLEDVLATRFPESVLASRDKLYAFVRRIAQNNLRDAGRKRTRSRQRVSPLPLEQAAVKMRACDLSAPDQLALKETVEEELPRIIGKLPALHQEAARMLLDHRRTVEVAARTGLNRRTVERIGHEVVAQVRRYIAD